MAMVVWIFAGGGEAEIRGLVGFFRKHLTVCEFERKTPIRPKRVPNKVQKKRQALGQTGESLAKQIEQELHNALSHGGHCDLILVLDDLDCHDSHARTKLFLDAIKQVEAAQGIKCLIGFAAPELEAWIIADWDNTIAKHIDFRQRHLAMQWWLSTQNDVQFDAPESFSHYDSAKGACQDKLSERLIEAALVYGQSKYSKAIHTPMLLIEYLNPQTVSNKCPLFRNFYTALLNDCSSTG
jgi:hypothetical protein